MSKMGQDLSKKGLKGHKYTQKNFGTRVHVFNDLTCLLPYR